MGNGWTACWSGMVLALGGCASATASRSGSRTRQFTFAVTVRATGPITLTEHDGAARADPGDLPAVSDETRTLLAG
ncbi:hypothetical protein ABZ154_18875 [Streptomyces sp. NPDC006261]|uniref:hypothetical protein n=1 Tax=Streptomyces sp. NPDC006261 TaxID=3156739 RepID=UPI0033BC6EC4